MSVARWDEVVRAYEAELVILEEARAAYEAAVRSVICDLTVELRKHSAQIRHPEDVDLKILDEHEEEGFARWVARCELQFEGQPWMSITARVSSAWGGPAHLLNIRAESRPPQEYRTHFKELARQSDGWHVVADACVREGTVDLTEPDPIPLAHEVFSGLVVAAGQLLERLIDSTSDIQRALHALDACREELSQSPIAADQGLVPRGQPHGHWAGLCFVQLNRKERPGVWVGVDPERRRVVYGHDTSQDPELAQRFSQVISCKPDTHGGYPAGTLLDKGALADASEAEITKRCMEALRLFVGLTEEETRGPLP
jgi:hypothetical protein